MKLEKRKEKESTCENRFYENDLSNSKLSILEISEATMIESKDPINLTTNEDPINEEKDDDVFETKDTSKILDFSLNSTQQNDFNRMDLSMDVGETEVNDAEVDIEEECDKLIVTDADTSKNGIFEKLDETKEILKQIFIHQQNYHL